MNGMEPGSVRIWLDEPNVIFRRGLAACLVTAGFEVVGESVHLAPVPDLDRTSVLVVQADEGGVSAAARLVAGTGVRLVGISGSTSQQVLLRAVEAGFAGFLVRSDLTPDGLVAAVRAVACGAGSIPPRSLSRLLDDLAHAVGPRAGRAPLLAARELDVLRLLAEGDSTREIANALCYSERTVKNIVHDTLSKLRCRTRAQAVAVAARQGAI